MKKSILFVVNSMSVGGVEKALLTYLQFLPIDKYDITVGLVDRTGSFLNQIPQHVRVVEIKSLHENSWRWRTDAGLFREIFKRRSYSSLFMIPVLRVISKLTGTLIPLYSHYINSRTDDMPEYDVAVSFQGPSQILDYYVGKVVKARKKIGWIHFDVDQFFMNPVTTAKAYKDFSRVFVVSDSSLQSFRKRLPSLADRSEALLNFIDWSTNYKLADEFNPFENKTPEVRQIVTVGRIRYQKGQDIAIKAARILRDRGYKFMWTMVGDGSELEKNLELCKSMDMTDYITFAGSTSNPYPYIKNCDIYVQPSRFEGFCLTIGEAKIFGVPIVATDFQGAHEQLDDVKNAVIIPEATPEEIAEGVMKAWGMPRVEFIPTEVPQQITRLMQELDS